ncbi:MAG: hypothetical protein GXO63_02520 [Candidatus Micrarchaeota archaeon]|nr:hypothetical protein [Candidatus Micrarchaeota archaeon]
MDTVLVVNVFNLAVAFVLMAVTVNAYFSFRLAIFKRIWLFLIAGSFLWFLGHVLMILRVTGPVHYVLFTVYIIVLAIGIYLLSRNAKKLGGV